MKRKLVAILTLCVMLALCVVGVIGCNGNTADNRDQNIVEVYNTYVSYAQQNGQTPLSYEEWLKSIKGEKGDKGQDGKDGVDGENGDDGKSAYQIWLDLGNSGTEQDFLNWLKGQDGANGETPTIEISEDGYWIINGIKTEYKAIGQDGANGETPTIEISEDGYWIINGIKTEYKAIGQDGANGTNGIGIESVRIDENGHLKIKYTNSEQEVDLGKIKETANYSKGLDFELNEEQTGYILTGVGYCNDRKVIIPSQYNDKPVVAIGEKAFYNDSFITAVEIPSSVMSIGGTEAFYNCSNLKSVTFGENSKLESIGDRAFNNCKSLESIEIPSSVTSIGEEAFYYCSKLKSVTFGENSKLESIGWGAFWGCSSLESIEIPSSVTSIGSSAFSSCDNLTDVYHNGTIEDWCKIEFSNYYSNPMYYAENFYIDGKEVTEIEIPSSITNIKDYAFSGFNNLTKITIPSSVTSIGYEAFLACSNLKSVTFGENSKLESIGDRAFVGCYSLESIEIPSSVTSIGYDAFWWCDPLTIYCQATSQPSGWHSNWNSSNCPVVWGYKG